MCHRGSIYCFLLERGGRESEKEASWVFQSRIRRKTRADQDALVRSENDLACFLISGHFAAPSVRFSSFQERVRTVSEQKAHALDIIIQCRHVHGGLSALFCKSRRDLSPAVVKDVGAAERVSLVGVKGRDGVFEETAFVEVMKTS